MGSVALTKSVVASQSAEVLSTVASKGAYFVRPALNDYTVSNKNSLKNAV